MIGIFEALNAWYCPAWFKKRVHIEGLEHLNDNRDRGILLLARIAHYSMPEVLHVRYFLIWMWCIDLKIILSWISSFIVVALGFIKTRLQKTICVA